MAGRKTSAFSVNSRRSDPYKNFKFRAAFVPLVAAAVAGVTASVLTRKLSAKRTEGKGSRNRRASIDTGFLRRLRF